MARTTKHNGTYFTDKEGVTTTISTDGKKQVMRHQIYQDKGKKTKWIVLGCALGAVASAGVATGIYYGIVNHNKANAYKAANAFKLEATGNILQNKDDTIDVQATNYKENVELTVHSDVGKIVSWTTNNKKDGMTFKLNSEYTGKDYATISVEATSDGETLTQNLHVYNKDYNRVPASWTKTNTWKLNFNGSDIAFKLKNMEEGSKENFTGIMHTGDTAICERYVDTNGQEHLVMSGFSNVAFEQEDGLYYIEGTEKINFQQEITDFNTPINKSQTTFDGNSQDFLAKIQTRYNVHHQEQSQTQSSNFSLEK